MAENSCFGEIHQELDAKLIPCGKWNLPLFYPGGSVAEHRNSRSGAGIFDQSGIRCFQIAGKNAAGVLEENLLYPVAGLAVGCAAENLLLSGEGRVAAVFTLCRMKEDDFMLLLQRSTAEKDVVYLKQLFSTIPIVRELTENMAFLTVAGSRSREILQEAGADGLPEDGKWQMITILDEEGDQFRCIAIGHDRFGEPGFDLCCNAAVALEVYGAVYRIPGAVPAGLGAWESLRIESRQPGIPEFSGENFPTECGFKVSMDDKRQFAGCKALETAGTFRILAMVEFERHPAPPGSVIKISGNIAAGVVTSGAFCPVSGRAGSWCRFDGNAGVRVGDSVGCVINNREVSGVITAIAGE